MSVIASVRSFFKNVPPLFKVAVSVKFPLLCFFEVRSTNASRIDGWSSGYCIRLVCWSANCAGDGVRVGVDVGDGRCGSVVISVGWRSIFRSRVGRCKCWCSRETVWC